MFFFVCVCVYLSVCVSKSLQAFVVWVIATPDAQSTRVPVPPVCASVLAARLALVVQRQAVYRLAAVSRSARVFLHPRRCTVVPAAAAPPDGNCRLLNHRAVTSASLRASCGKKHNTKVRLLVRR